MFLISTYGQDRNLNYFIAKCNTFLSLLVLLENPITIFSKDISYSYFTWLWGRLRNNSVAELELRLWIKVPWTELWLEQVKAEPACQRLSATAC